MTDKSGVPTDNAMEALLRLTRAIANAEDPETVIAVLADAAIRQLHADRVSVIRIHADGFARVHGSRGFPDAVSWPVDPSPDEWVSAVESEGISDHLGLPLASGGGLYGFLMLGWKGTPHSDPERRVLAEGFADSAAIGLDRAFRTTQMLDSFKQVAAQRAEATRTEGLRQLGQLSATLAHEIRNPLAGIRGVLDVIRGGFDEGADERRMAGRAIDRLDQLNNLVSELLVYASPRRPEAELTLLRPLLQETLAMVDPAGAELVLVEGDDTEWPLDRTMVGRLMLNLVRNATEAAGPNGRVEVHHTVHTNQLKVSVDDDGPGVSEEMVPTLFEPFATDKVSGTGLGLTVSQRIAEVHGGTIRYERSPLGGARFEVTLGEILPTPPRAP